MSKFKERIFRGRERMNRGAERFARRAIEKLEKLPPLPVLLERCRNLKWPALFIGGLLLGDLLMQSAVSFFLSDPGKARAPRVVQDKAYLRSLAVYQDTIKINAFCPGCKVPDMTIRSIQRPKDCGKARPLANSSVKVIGTIVLSNPKFSVATLQMGGESVAVRSGEEVKQVGKVFEIRRNRICFLNDDGLLHYVELPEENTIAFGQPLPSALPASSYEGIAQKTDGEFEIKRTFLLDKLKDPNLLFQAKAVVYKENGVPKGFKILNIVPGSVYEALGIQVNDVIVGVNGEPMNSLSRAQELYAAARDAKDVQLEVLRGGSPVTLKYQVK